MTLYEGSAGRTLAMSRTPDLEQEPEEQPDPIDAMIASAMLERRKRR